MHRIPAKTKDDKIDAKNGGKCMPDIRTGFPGTQVEAEPESCTQSEELAGHKIHLVQRDAQELAERVQTGGPRGAVGQAGPRLRCHPASSGGAAPSPGPRLGVLPPECARAAVPRAARGRRAPAGPSCEPEDETRRKVSGRKTWRSALRLRAR